MAKENDIFGSIKLEETVKDSDLDGKETTEDDMILAGIGFNIAKIEAYKKRFNKETVLHQGYPTNDMFEWYLKAGSVDEISLLIQHKDKLRENQAKKLTNIKDETITQEPNDSIVASYIQKNADLLTNNSELVQRNNELFKKISELQSERDKLEMYLASAKEIEDKHGKDNEKLANEAMNNLRLNKKLIQIFIQQKIKADLTTEEIEKIKELSK